MKLSRSVLLSVEILAAHKLRTLLSVTGIVVGVGAVVLMVSVGERAERRVVDRIRAMGTNLVVVNAAAARMVAGRQRPQATATTLEPAHARLVAEACASCARVAPAVTRGMQAQWESRIWNTTVSGTTEDGLAIRNVRVAAGRAFDAEDDRLRRRVALVGPTLVANLFGGRDPIGQTFLVGKVPFEVVGVTASKGVDAQGTDQDDLVLVPLEAAMRRLLRITYVQQILVQARSSEALDAAEQEVRDALRARRSGGDARDDFTIQNQAALVRTQRETSRSLTLMVVAVASISLVVGGVGILAVMLIAIRERRREIGLRRALGARFRDILVQFLAEGALVAAAGGVLGVGLGMGASLIAAAFGPEGAVLPWPAAGAALAFALTVGLVFGIYPALRAARLEPIAALRAE